jgi:hypothetical protein
MMLFHVNKRKEVKARLKSPTYLGWKTREPSLPLNSDLGLKVLQKKTRRVKEDRAAQKK